MSEDGVVEAIEMVNGNFFLAAFFFLRFRNKDFQNTIFKVGFGIIKLQIPGQRDGSFE